MAQKVTTHDEKRLLEFVRTQVDTFIKWELVRFFHDNPYATDTAENIARFAGREPHLVKEEMEQLVSIRLLDASTTGSVRLYRYTKDQDARDLVASFVAACDDRDFRMRATNLVIEGLQ